MIATFTRVLAQTSVPEAPSFASIFFWSNSPSGGLDWVGSAMIWLLIALSAFNIYLIASLVREMRPESISPASTLEHVRTLVLGERYREALEATRTDPSDLGRMLHAAFGAAPKGEAAMLDSFVAAADEARADRLRTIERLNVLGQISPMIGLFGTVYGMIVAFQTIASSGGAADPVLLAGGIGTALVTTFWGLLIAIPALTVYASLRTKIERASALAEREAETILSLFGAKRDAA